MDATTKYQLMGVLGLGGLGGVLAYFLRAKVDIWRASRGAEVNQAQAPMTVLLQIVQNKEKENAELRADMKLILTNHLEHDRKEREAVIQSLSKSESKDEAVVAALNELTHSIREDRAAAAAERKTLHERLNLMHIDIVKGRS